MLDQEFRDEVCHGPHSKHYPKFVHPSGLYPLGYGKTEDRIMLWVKPDGARSSVFHDTIMIYLFKLEVIVMQHAPDMLEDFETLKRLYEENRNRF